MHETPPPDELIARRRLAQQKHYQAHSLQIRERSRNWYNNNREKASAVRKQYYQSHRSRACERNRNWRKNNPERKAATDRAYARKNREFLNQYKAGWRKMNRPTDRRVRRNQAGKHRQRLSDRYIRDVLRNRKAKIRNPTQEQIAATRASVSLFRAQRALRLISTASAIIKICQKQ